MRIIHEDGSLTFQCKWSSHSHSRIKIDRIEINKRMVLSGWDQFIRLDASIAIVIQQEA